MEIHERPPTSRRSIETYRAPRGRVHVDVETTAPFKPWAELEAYLRAVDPRSNSKQPHPRFAQGDHVAIIGPTGTGKTHIALALAELRTYSLLVACKPKDPLVDDAIKAGYWLVPGNTLEIPYSDGRPLHPRVVYWPRLGGHATRKVPPEALLKAEKALQKRGVGSAIGYVRRDGHWCLILDEGTWICRDLNLQRDVDSALMGFRTLNASIIILGQRPSWMGRYVLNQPTHLFIFQTADDDDRQSLGNISGFDKKVVAEIVRQLDHTQHEALYLNTRTREMFRTVAPPR